MELQRTLLSITATISFYTFFCCIQYVTRTQNLPLTNTTLIIYSVILILRNLFQKKKPNEPFTISIILSFFCAILEFIIIYASLQLILHNNLVLVLFIALLSFHFHLIQRRTEFSLVSFIILIALFFILILANNLEIIEATQTFISQFNIERMYFRNGNCYGMILLFTIMVRLFIANVYVNSVRYKPYCLVVISVVYGLLFYNELGNELNAIRNERLYSCVAYLAMCVFTYVYSGDDDSFALCSLCGFFVCIASFSNYYNSFFVKTRFEVITDVIYYWVALGYPLVLTSYFKWDISFVRAMRGNGNQETTNENNAGDETANNINNAGGTGNGMEENETQVDNNLEITA